MANMKVVNTDWTGCCVIACDCGSEEPVVGTISLKRKQYEVKELEERVDQCDLIANTRGTEVGRLEREVKKLRDENRERIRELESLERKAFNYSEKNLELNNTIVEQEQRLSELSRLGSLTNDEMREEWKGFVKMLQETQEENSELKNTITDMEVEDELLGTDIKLLRREVMRSQSIEQDGQGLISKGNAKISRLEFQLSTWKKLWMKEREYRHNLSDRVDVATRGLRALSDKDPWARWPMKEANEEE